MLAGVSSAASVIFDLSSRLLLLECPFNCLAVAGQEEAPLPLPQINQQDPEGPRISYSNVSSSDNKSRFPHQESFSDIVAAYTHRSLVTVNPRRKEKSLRDLLTLDRRKRKLAALKNLRARKPQRKIAMIQRREQQVEEYYDYDYEDESYEDDYDLAEEEEEDNEEDDFYPELALEIKKMKEILTPKRRMPAIKKKKRKKSEIRIRKPSRISKRKKNRRPRPPPPRSHSQPDRRQRQTPPPPAAHDPPPHQHQTRPESRSYHHPPPPPPPPPLRHRRPKRPRRRRRFFPRRRPRRLRRPRLPSAQSLLPAFLTAGSLLGFGLGAFTGGDAQTITFNPTITQQGDNITLTVNDTNNVSNNVSSQSTNTVTNTLSNTNNNNVSTTTIPVTVSGDGKKIKPFYKNEFVVLKIYIIFKLSPGTITIGPITNGRSFESGDSTMRFRTSGGADTRVLLLLAQTAITLSGSVPEVIFLDGRVDVEPDSVPDEKKLIEASWKELLW